MKIGLASIGRFLLAVLATLVLAEIVLRVIGPPEREQDTRSFHEVRPDKEWIYGLRPNATGTFPGSELVYQSNADGFRDHAYERPKPEGVFRIVVLGDSVTFGVGVPLERTWTKKLEERLNTLAEREGGPRVEVLSLGVGGYNPYNQAALLEDVGLTYEPDLVLVQFCINDLNDPTAHFDLHTRLHLGTIPDAAYPDPALRREPPKPPGALLRLCRYSRLCSLVDDAQLAANALFISGDEVQSAMQPVEADDGPQWPWLESMYRRIDATSRENDARFAVLAFPYRAQIEGSGSHPVTERLTALGERNGWATIDPLEAFRAAGAQTPLFLDAWHPTAAGHRIAASETARSLSCGGLLTSELNAVCSE